MPSTSIPEFYQASLHALSAHTCFTATGARSATSRATWVAACEAVGVPGLLFHDLRRSGARNY
jgi:hypothetical protein